MKARTVWRKKRNGKFYGNWLVTVDGVDVNLGTKSATIAHQLVPEAERGRRNFQSDTAAAAAALDQVDAAGVEGTARGTENQARPDATIAPIPPTVPSAPAAPAQAAQAGQEAAPAQAAQAGQAVSAEENARQEAAATNAAATETSTAAPDPSNDNGAPAPISPDAMAGMLAMGAEAMVELQLGLQGWIIKRKTGKEPGLLPPDSPMRKIASECWAAQFKLWFPDLSTVPPWVGALVMVGACAPYQLATATPIPKKEGADLGAAETAAQGPEQAAA